MNDNKRAIHDGRKGQRGEESVEWIDQSYHAPNVQSKKQPSRTFGGSHADFEVHSTKGCIHQAKKVAAMHISSPASGCRDRDGRKVRSTPSMNGEPTTASALLRSLGGG